MKSRNHTAVRFLRPLAIGTIVGVSLIASAQAQTLKFANQGDALSMDPHSLNESFQLSFTGNIYEPLIGRGKKLEVVPALATDWKQTAPTVWRFNLRKGVTFHDGSPFTAEDVIFSYNRAKGEGSDVKTYVGQIKEIRKIDDHTIDIVTTEPFAILPEVITNWYILPKNWAEANKATQPVDKRKGIENYASFQANGTGPYRLRSREPNVRTTLQRNGRYWGKIEGNVQEVIFTPIGNNATRVAALLSGEIDMMEPVPVQDIARISANPNLKVMQAPELRTIFLGMDQSRNELLQSNVKGKNPFKDKRVRQAFYQAIDVNAIQKTVMRGASAPTGLMIAPGINGFVPDMNKRLSFDPEALEEAAGRGRVSARLRSRHELPERSLRQRRRDLQGGGRDACEGRYQAKPDGGKQGHVLSEDSVAQHVVLSARLDAWQLRLAQPAVRGDVDAG